MSDRHLFYGRHDHAVNVDNSGFSLPGAELHYPPDLELEPVHTDLELAVDIENETLSAVITHTVVSRRKGPRKIELNAVDFADVAVRDPDDNALTWSYDGQHIVVLWNEGFDALEKRHLEVSYVVRRPAAGLYFRQPSEAWPNAARYAATDNETERARHWLACIDLPNVRPTLEFRIQAPSGLTTLANGYKVSEHDAGDGTTTTRWRLDQRCPSYLTCFVVGDLVRCDDGEFDGKPIAYFAPAPHTAEDLHRSFGRSGEMLAWMTKLLDQPFPFPKYFQFALPGFGGAMENISLVSWDSVFVTDEEMDTEWGWLVDQINVHEMAHSYFGDLVVCRDYAHAWLKESWATYIESCWLEHKKGEDEYRYDLFTSARLYFEEADNSYMRPIMTRRFSHSWDMYDYHLYPGGAVRLHMLRKLLGDDVFWHGVRNYMARYAHKVVESDDFRRELEAVSGRSLGRFFDQWFGSRGYPSLEVTFEYDKEKKEGRFGVTQKQVDDKEGIGTFDLRISLAWAGEDGVLVRREVDIARKNEQFVFPMESDPKQVRVDPDLHAVLKLEFNPGDDKLKTQLTDAKDVVGRILAARELIGSGKASNIEAVAKACKDEPFWGVRADIYRLLGEAGVQAAADALSRFVAEESDPKVYFGLMMAASKYRDAGIRAAITKRLERKDLKHRGTHAAWVALGKQREHAPLDALAATAREHSFHGWIQAGALQGLAESRQRAALPILSELLIPGVIEDDRARAAGTAAIGNLARALEPADKARAMERLTDLLRDPMERVRNAAASGLAGLDEPAVIGTLERFKAPLSEQDRVGMDRRLAGLRGRLRNKASGSEKELETLRDTIRKLEARLTKLEASTQSLGA